MRSFESQHTPLRLLSLAFLLIAYASAQEVFKITSPHELIKKLPQGQAKTKLSSLGLKPRLGELYGQIVLANPQSACSEVQSVIIHNENENHNETYGGRDIFLMANDEKCMESVKARNIVLGGAKVALIKQNINNTLHDKQVDSVHIPVIQIEPQAYDIIQKFKTDNPHIPIKSYIDFGTYVNRKKIQMELWMSPTQTKAYQFIQELATFITNQPDIIQFRPRFVFHSQKQTKQFVGCLSSGRYCPPQIQFQGKSEGAKIVAEGLRQIIINSRNSIQWFKYVPLYTKKCLGNQIMWTGNTSDLCSEAIMRSIGIDADHIQRLYMGSFFGERPEVDDNYYLLEQRQAYIYEKIITHPQLLINGQQLNIIHPQKLKLRICSMIHPDPSQQTPQCQKLTQPAFFSTGQIFIGIGILVALIVVIMVIYKFVIHRKMKKEMKGEVDKTLTQYYRYMDTFEEPDPYAVGKVALVQQKVESNQMGSIELGEYPNKKEQTEKKE